ncbi:MAG TPA: signal peptidase I [Vineibacter sp.]|nr:signal peptidase I [Vineibacter sp.]
MSRKEQSGGWMETVKTVVYAVLIAIVARTFAFEPFNIPSGSMIPTLLVGDYLFVSKYSYGYSKHSFPLSLAPFSGRIFERPPHVGDVAVFKWPGDNRTDYIKRIIGVAGDRVQVKGGVLFVNDKQVDMRPAQEAGPRPAGGSSDGQIYVEVLPGGMPHFIQKKKPLGSPKEPGDDPNNTREFLVPQGHVFVMGDNRDESADSRVLSSQVGFVPVENLVGRAEFIFFSHDGSASLWEVWKWPEAIRFSRMFNGIR